MKSCWLGRALILIVSLSLTARADGELDPRFAPQLLNAGLAARLVNAVLVQADGKLLAGGVFRTVNGVPRAGLVRFNADGSLDAGFNPIAAATSPYSLGVTALAQQPDGRLLVQGQFAGVAGGQSIIRLLPDGRLDESFQRYFTGSLAVFALLPDGKIVTSSYSDVVRLNANGTFDRILLTPIGAVSGGSVGVGVQPDGKILLGGSVFNPIGSSNSFFARRNADGSHDDSFKPELTFGGAFNGAPIKLLVQPDGKIIAAGYFGTIYNSFPGVIRFLPDGGRDPSFTLNLSGIRDMLLQPDGRLVLAGELSQLAGSPRRNLLRVNADGSLDASFDPGAGPNGPVSALALQADGRLLAGGRFTQVNNELRTGLARFQADGRLDNSFKPLVANLAEVRYASLAPDGKLVVAGSFDLIGGLERRRLARLNADGTLDTGFAPPADFSGDLYKLAVQTDGKVLALAQNNEGHWRMRRWLLNGASDTTFNSPIFNTVSLNGVNDGLIAVQTDGKVLLSGVVSRNPLASLLRLNPDGSEDTSFAPPTQLRGIIQLARLPGGKILAAGLTEADGQRRLSVARLKPDGALDSFHEATFPNLTLITRVAQAPDGKLLIAGHDNGPNGSRQNFVLRLNQDATPDTSFNTAWLGPYHFDFRQTSYISVLAVQPNGKPLVAFGGERGLVRLNSDGSVDNSLNFRLYSPTSSDNDEAIHALLPQPDGQWVIGGKFDRVGLAPGAARYSLARVRLGATSAAAVTSAASFTTPVAPGSIASVFGVGLATATNAATGLPLPTMLADVTVKLTDRLGIEHRAPLFFVSPAQINFQVPPAAAPGTAALTVELQGSAQAAGTVNIAPVAPGLFTFNANGRGAPAGYALRVRGNTSIREAIHQLGADNRWEPRPIDLGPETEQVWLILFGTGVRGRAAMSGVTATIGGVSAVISYAGAQGEFAGLDQINLLIPRALAGRGAVEVVLSVDGLPARAVQISVQ